MAPKRRPASRPRSSPNLRPRPRSDEDGRSVLVRVPEPTGKVDYHSNGSGKRTCGVKEGMFDATGGLRGGMGILGEPLRLQRRQRSLLIEGSAGSPHRLDVLTAGVVRGRSRQVDATRRGRNDAKMTAMERLAALHECQRWSSKCAGCVGKRV